MMGKQPEVGELYTRRNGKVYEVKQAHIYCGDCAFAGKDHCAKVMCAGVIYVRRKDLEAV